MKLLLILVCLQGVLSAKVKYEKAEQVPAHPVCLRGFLLNQTTNNCTDIDECATTTHTCKSQDFCVNTPGSFACKCGEGYRGVLPVCHNIDECATGQHNCINSVEKGVGCQDTVGSFTCVCRPGWTGLFYEDPSDRPACNNTDECQTNVHNCHVNATCKDSVGSFQCFCQDGYVGDGLHCADLDECTTRRCSHLPNSFCNNTVGSFQCLCAAGFNLVNGKCENINECSTTNNCHSGATCTDSPGSYRCKCNVGYEGNGVTCNDVDECKTSKAACSNSPLPSVRCVNTPGSYSCNCTPGWTQQQADGTCRNVDECTTTPPQHNCDNKSVCKDTLGSFECQCKPGYQMNATTRTCEDLNECLHALPHGCYGTGQMCNNTIGSFECACAPGWETSSTLLLAQENDATEFFQVDSAVERSSLLGTQSSALTCTNVDECTAGTHSCHANATCQDMVGSYHCVCNTGYMGDGRTCSDFNECILQKANCHKDADCEDSVGSFTCNCNAGFAGNGVENCTDVNECANSATNTCSNQTAKCHNSQGSFYCLCNKGYSGNGVECTNVNECDHNVHTCKDNTVCVDTDGSFMCNCRPGYKLKNNTCIEIDECYDNAVARNRSSTVANICHDLADCKNTVGSFACLCRNGYAGDGTSSCVDVNECATGVHNCDVHAFCKNSQGSFLCNCLPGYNGSGIKYSGMWPPTDGCWDIDECLVRNTTINATMNETSISQNKTACRQEATCTNTVGSFSCACNKGYYGDGLVCNNIDECQTSKHNCHSSAFCKDTNGSFVCQCLQGYLDASTGAQGLSCVSAKSIEVGQFQAKNLSWQRVSFTSAFSSAPVVVLMASAAGQREISARVRRVTKTTFDVAISFLNTSNQADNDAFSSWIKSNLPTVSFMAAAPGKHKLPNGLVLQAGLVTPTKQMQRTTECSVRLRKNISAWNKIVFDSYPAKPALFAQIQGMSKKSWAGGGLHANDYCTAGVRFNYTWNETINKNDTIWVSRICEGMKTASYWEKEQIGWIAVANNVSNTTNFTYDGTGVNTTVKYASVSLRRNLTGNVVGEFADYQQTLTSAPVILAGKVSGDQHVIGWLHVEGALLSKAAFRVEEDKSCTLPRNRTEYFDMFVASQSFSV
eukprot:TRINITY_DN109038_c0_g1_i1.p1 TRINITY_DN109038_c0_g1~~TRINITY_DN109038_c0_g1_i1.p1  ORF type:complete len:1124 (+),score=194.27 TRINITY_DN109038_c0_g1_i1:90-3461(+)